MKNSIKFVALMTAAVMSAAAIPAVCISAANTTSSVSASASLYALHLLYLISQTEKSLPPKLPKAIS